eukprot:354898-Chlamydomonas_euryale.AAC.3
MPVRPDAACERQPSSRCRSGPSLPPSRRQAADLAREQLHEQRTSARDHGGHGRLDACSERPLG